MITKCSGYHNGTKPIPCGKVLKDHDRDTKMLLEACKLAYSVLPPSSIRDMVVEATHEAEIPSDGGPCESCEKQIELLKKSTRQ